MGLIPPEQIEIVRERADIIAIIGERLSLTQKGRQFWACCPFHQEKTASFSVHPDRQIYKCFGCQKGGNVFTFLQEYERVSFPEAVKIVADRLGIELKTRSGGDRGRLDERKQLFELSEWAAKFYEKQLWGSGAEAKVAQRYLKDRQISEESARTYRLGLSLPSWEALYQQARKDKKPIPLLVKLGLLIEKDDRRSQRSCYDRFRGRLMFPIADERGRVLAFGGRRLDDSDKKSPKYLNSAEVPRFFEKRRVLYGLDLAKQDRAERLIIVEGYTDAIMCRQFGIKGAIAVLGTAFGKDHIPLISRFSNQVVVLFDGDSAGRAAAQRSLSPLLSTDLELKVACLDAAKDPCDYLLDQGPEAFTEFLEGAPEVFDFLLDQAEEQAGASLAERARVIEETLALIAPLDSIRLHLHIGRFAHRFGVSEEDLRKRLVGLRGEGSSNTREADHMTPRSKSGKGGGRSGSGPRKRSKPYNKGPYKKGGYKKDRRQGHMLHAEDQAPRMSKPPGYKRFGRGAALRILEALLACPERAAEVFRILTPRHFPSGSMRDLATLMQVRSDLGQKFDEARLYDELDEQGLELLHYLSDQIHLGQSRNKNYEGELEPAACQRLVKTLGKQQRQDVRMQLQRAREEGDDELAAELEQELDELLREFSASS